MILEKLRKIAAMAHSPIAGEREAAENLLRTLAARHHIALEEILDETRRRCAFPYRNEDEKALVSQIVGTVLNRNAVPLNPHSREVVPECTRREEAEIRTKLSVYLPDFRRQREELLKRMKMFAAAYIQKNGIFPEKADGDAPGKPLTEDELKILIEMCGRIRKTVVHRQITNMEETR